MPFSTSPISSPKPNVDPALVKLLNLPPTATIGPLSGGGTSSASTFKITIPRTPSTAASSSPSTFYFLKTASSPTAEAMFRGEHASLSAIHAAVPSLCPRSCGWGELEDRRGTWFLVTEFVEFSSSSSSRRRRGSKQANAASTPPPAPESLAKKLSRLHSLPAPPPPHSTSSTPQFGFPVPTHCGDTQQDNGFRATWPDFFANNRLRSIAARCRERNGPDAELEALVERIVDEVVPRLLGEGHLGGEEGVKPVVVHGDLWGGNKGVGRFVGRVKEGGGEGEEGGRRGGEEGREGNGMEEEEIIFDASACYAHSEFDLGIMRMFGGFGEDFFNEYHSYMPKTEPEDEYADRLRLYESYHHLNHHAIFRGAGYRSGAMGILRGLLGKYGSKGK